MPCLLLFFLYCMVNDGCDIKLSSGHLRQQASYLLGQSHNSQLKTAVNKVPYVKLSAYVKLLLTCHLLDYIPRWSYTLICQVLLLRHVVIWFHFQKNIIYNFIMSWNFLSDLVSTCHCRSVSKLWIFALPQYMIVCFLTWGPHFPALFRSL